MHIRSSVRREHYLNVDPFGTIGKAKEYLRYPLFPEIQASVIIDQLIDITNDARYSSSQRAILKLLVSDMAAPEIPWAQKFRHLLRPLRKEAINMIAEFAPQHRAHFFCEILNGYDESHIVHNTSVDFSQKTKTAIRRLFDLTVIQFDEDQQNKPDSDHALADQLYEVGEGLERWGFYLITTGRENTDTILYPYLSPRKKKSLMEIETLDYSPV